MDVPLSWLIISICVLAHFFFSAGETALACANRFKMQLEADAGKKTARLVLHVCEKYDRALITVLSGINVVAIVASAISTILFYNVLSSSGLLILFPGIIPVKLTLKFCLGFLLSIVSAFFIFVPGISPLNSSVRDFLILIPGISPVIDSPTNFLTFLEL